MAWSYEPTELSTTPLYQVRFKLGDTNDADQQLSDEELLQLLAESGSVEGAVRRAALVLATKYARHSDKWVGDLKILYSQRARAYRELAESSSLKGVSSTYRVPSAGGIRLSDKEGIEADDDLVVPSFRRNLHDNVEDT